ncbi:dTDP-4-dehydrorhamnose reductase [Flavobacteriaceae bacterium]|nr:dTDP-4-dehydrorhamnose reductase [Flavobacteriaceae bacterium]MDB4179895.1 dTDP-4-dehydrorhamnose reductase [Flavobacteriaceae bacterium]
MKILVTGGNGQLGCEINQLSSNYNYDWLFTDTDIFDISDLININFFLDKCNPDVIINCAAYTAVDNAEVDFEKANTINHKAVELIAQWSKKNNCKLIHISTDYVYDGTSFTPVKEDMQANPVNNYGKTKLFGDIACLKNNPSSIIIRTCWLYSSFCKNFVTNMINLMKSKSELKVINDQVGSPTYAGDLAKTILDLITHKNWIPGIYHFTNLGKVSWFDFANDIKSIYGFNTSIDSISSKEYSIKTKRPKYSLLDNSKIKNTFDIIQMNYLDSLNKCIKILQNES